jgi:hypothetical protein
MAFFLSNRTHKCCFEKFCLPGRRGVAK